MPKTVRELKEWLSEFHDEDFVVSRKNGDPAIAIVDRNCGDPDVTCEPWFFLDE